MNFLIIIKVALRSLRRTVLRSILTMLGIIIGVGAVIAMVGIGNGARARVEALVAGMDAGRIVLQARMPRSEWRGGQPPPVPPGDGLKIEDYSLIRQRIPGIVAASPEVVAQGGPSFAAANGRSGAAQIMGVDVDGLSLYRRQLLTGANFGSTDVRSAATVCLLSRTVAVDLFGQRDPVGRTVRLREVPFVVIGVMSDDELFRRFQPDARDSSVFVPYSSLLRRLDRNARLGLHLRTDDPSRLAEIQQQVTDLIEERRGARRAEFAVNDPTEGMRSYTDSVTTMTALLASIAGISLLVGGIGIMNIMLVSVTERTREIGIRLAIGTRGRDVLRQFVLEAVILSVIGGLVGIAFGLTASQVITRMNGWPTHITASAIVGAFLTSAAIGIFFGWYPARKAARLDPIEALRYE